MASGKIFVVTKRKRKPRVSVKKVNKKLNKLIRSIEIKEKNTLASLQLTGGSDTSFTLNEMERGNANGQRAGDQIVMKRLLITVRLLIPELLFNATDASQTNWTFSYKQSSMRVIVYMDKQNNNASPAPATNTILENAGNQAQKVKSQYDFMFVNHKYNILRYNILYDRVHVLTQNGHQEKFINIRKSLNHKVNYSTNNNNPTDIIDNRIHILFIPVDDQIQIAYSSTIFYSDA